MTNIERSTEIVAKFLEWTPEIGPCPIGINNHVWFKRLCAMGEKQADLEATIDALRKILYRVRQVGDYLALVADNEDSTKHSIINAIDAWKYVSIKEPK